MKQLFLWISLAFLMVGCAPNTNVNIPLDKYGYTNINMDANGNINGGVSGNANNTSVNTRF